MWARSVDPSRARVGRAASAQRWSRAPFLILAIIALLGGLWGALGRLGLTVAAPPTLMASHGPLLSMGFLGTVISLERAVALGRRPAFAAAALGGLGALSLALGLPFALWSLAAAALAFTAMCAFMWRVRPELPTFAMLLGGIAWAAAATGLALGAPIARVVPLLAAFLVLTVVGERVGLSKIARPPTWSRSPFVLGCGLLLSGAAAAVASTDATRVAGLGLLVLAAWLALWDLAWRNARRTGVARYMAVALAAGYVWLAVAAITWLVAPDAATIFAYDALIHTVFVGFVLSMIFAHELMIVPAILGIALPFTRAFYVPLVLLHASLAVRIAGDALGDAGTWQWAATANVIAVLLFAVLSAASARGLVNAVPRRAAAVRRI